VVGFLNSVFRRTFRQALFGVTPSLFLFVSPYFAHGDITVRVANLKQDMELVTRELAGLRTEVELLRRENAQLKVQVEQFNRKQSSNAGVSSGALQRMSDRLLTIESRLSHSEKTQIALQNGIEAKMGSLISQMNKGFEQVHSPPPKSSPVPSFNQDYPQNGFVHKVEKGETVSSIAKKYSSKTQWIIHANQIVDPKRVFIGKELFVPQN
jgi:LysM repeat protein